MAGELEGLVVPVMEPLGYRHGWAGEVNRRIAEAAQRTPAGLEMSWRDLSQLGTGDEYNWRVPPLQWMTIRTRSVSVPPN